MSQSVKQLEVKEIRELKVAAPVPKRSVGMFFWKNVTPSAGLPQIPGTHRLLKARGLRSSTFAEKSSN